MLKQRPLNYILLTTSLVLYGIAGYILERHDSALLVSAFTMLFILYGWIWFTANDVSSTFWMYAAVLLRVSLLFAIPALSDDAYRFLWDGHLVAHGYHPFAHVPAYYIDHDIELGTLRDDLFQNLNSPGYFTIYPPIPQFTFWLAAIISPHSIVGGVVVMRLFILAAEIGNLYLIHALLVRFNLPKKNVLLYALNPLVIIELTGNLHHEAFMIFFVLLTLYFINTRHLLSGMAFGAAICSKLVPLLFIPVILHTLRWRKGSGFGLAAAVASLLLFTPLLSAEFISGFRESIGYYVSYFEFNASLYYIVREAGYFLYGYNIIQTVGWKLMSIAAMVIVLYSVSTTFRKKTGLYNMSGEGSHHTWPVDFMITLFLYFLFTTTLHPWYIASLVALAVFTSFRFPILWSYLIFLTYIGYTQNSFTENIWVVWIEYLGVFSFLAFELYNNRPVQTVNTTSHLKSVSL